MGVRVEKFDPSAASEADVRSYYEVMIARYADDRARWTAPTFEELQFRLRTPFQGLGPAHHWAARLEGGLVAFVSVHFPDWEDASLVEVVVHPRVRRRGLGATLLRAVLPELEARGRGVIECWQVTRNGDGARWAANLGLRTVNSMIIQKLTFADVDSTLWDVPVAAGYRLEQWVGHAPEDLLVSYAAARNAIHDAPVSDQNNLSPQWTPSRVREAEKEYADRGAESRVVVAVRESTGAVAGMTELELHSERPRRAFQQETSVLAAHRGHGLGRAIKAHMIRWVRQERPKLTQIETVTAAGNIRMAGVNHSIGFVTIGDMVSVKAPIAEVRLD